MSNQISHIPASADDREARLYAKKQLQTHAQPQQLAPIPRAWPRSSHIKGVFAKKSSAPTALDVVSPYHSTTFMLTPPTAYSYNSQSSTGKSPSPSKRISLQKYYYGRNTMSVNAVSSSRARTPSPPQSPRPPMTSVAASMSSSIPAFTSTFLSSSSSTASVPSSPAESNGISLSHVYAADSTGTFSTTTATCTSTRNAADAGSSSVFLPAPLRTQSSTSSLVLSIPPPTVVMPTLNTILATPITPSQNTSLSALPSSLPLAIAPRLSISPPPSLSPSNCSPSFAMLSSSPPSSSCSSPSFSSSPPSPSLHRMTAPQQSDLTPYPASSISPAKLATFIEGADSSTMQHLSLDDACAGSQRSQQWMQKRPLILDLRPQPDFSSLSIQQSINLNMPTLLMRRYRRGVAVSSCSIESFITMPSDKDLFHSIQENWRSSSTSEPVDIIVLDQEMCGGQEAYGRSATAAWTLLNVLEQGAGQYFYSTETGSQLIQQQPIRLWFLEGGFEAFQTWDAGEKFLVREGLVSTSSVASLTCSVLSCSPPSMSPLPATREEEMPLAQKPQRRASMKPSLSIDTASITFTPKGSTTTTTNSNKPVRRESLFSLNTKALQRPPGMSRSQTVGAASAPHLKPLSIPSLNTMACSNQQQKSSWLTVPNSTQAPALSPTMSMVGSHSMDMMSGLVSASTDHAFSSASSTWSADSNSINGSGHFNHAAHQTLKSKRSVSSINTTATSIREEGEESETDLSSFSPDSQRQNKSHNDFHSEYQSRMFGASETNTTMTGCQYFGDHNDTRHYDNIHGYPEDCHMDYTRDEDEEEEDKGEQEISCILPNFLFLGPEIVTEAQVQELQRLGVKRVLNMAKECEDKVIVCKSDQFEYHKIGVYDHIEADVSAGLLQAVDIIASSTESPIYVHCKAGKSRSVTATIAYLIMHLHWPLNKAYQHVLTQRPCMCPNIGFVTELMNVEKKTLGAENATGLHMQRV
ncbi:hypothetical protein BG004_004899 [Podila humilis]|nr:hypothetical protein BG004_004899 [Podila humilis]